MLDDAISFVTYAVPATDPSGRVDALAVGSRLPDEGSAITTAKCANA